MYLKTFEICLEIYELDRAHLLSAPGLAWQEVLKKTKVQIDLLTDIDMLFTVEKDIEVSLFIDRLGRT